MIGNQVEIRNEQSGIVLFRGYKTHLRNIVDETLAFETFPYPVLIEIALVTPEEIRRLNREFRGKDAPTDVLSFPLTSDAFEPDPDDFEGRRLSLGDVIVCPEVIREQSLRFGTTFKQELSLMVIHSVLHLIGYDHLKKEEKKEMFARQEAILALCEDQLNF